MDFTSSGLLTPWLSIGERSRGFRYDLPGARYRVGGEKFRERPRPAVGAYHPNMDATKASRMGDAAAVSDDLDVMAEVPAVVRNLDRLIGWVEPTLQALVVGRDTR